MVEDGLCKQERLVLGLLGFIVVVLGNAEVDAGSALEGGKESGRHAPPMIKSGSRLPRTMGLRMALSKEGFRIPSL